MRILVVGGGIAGLTVAWWLHRSGHRPMIIDRASSDGGADYMIELFGFGYEVSSRMGLVPALDRIHHRTPRLRYFARDGTQKFDLDYDAIRHALFNDRHFLILRSELEQVLQDAVRNRVEIRHGPDITSMSQDSGQVYVNFSDQDPGAYDLVVGADGMHSLVRRLVFGDEATLSRQLGHTAGAFITDGRNIDVPGDAISRLTEPGRQVSVHPLADGRLAALFLSRFGSASGPDCESPYSKFRRAYDDMSWIVPDLLNLGAHTEGFYFEDVTDIALPRWSKGRVTLIGDACGGVSLPSGQGASLAMATAYVLAGELTNNTKDHTLPFLHYEQRLRPELERRQRAGIRLGGGLVPDTRAGLLLNNFALKLASRPLASSLIKQRFSLSETMS